MKRCSPYPHIVKLVVEFVDTFTVAHHLESSLVKIWGCRKSDDDGGLVVVMLCVVGDGEILPFEILWKW